MSSAPAPLRPEPARRPAAPARRHGVVRPPQAAAPVTVPPRRKGLFEKVDPIWVVLALVFVSLSIHVGVAYGANIVAAMKAAAERVKQTITVAVVEKAKPPPPEPEPPPPPPEPPKPKAKPKPVPVPELKPPPEAPPPPPDTPPAPPPPNETPPPTATNEPPPMVIAGLSFSSTSTNGSFSVNVGNTLYGAVPDKAVKPEDVKPYKAERYEPPHLVSELPAYLGNLSENEFQRYYPDEARRGEQEGQVKAKITIDDDGSVVKVVIVSCSAPNVGFEDAARKILPLMKFKPAKINGQPVATEINYTLTFELPY